MPYGESMVTEIWVNIGSGNGLLPAGSKPLPEVLNKCWHIIGAWWCHQMQTFSSLLAICAGNSPVTGYFPAQRPVTRSFEVFFDLCLNKWLSKQWWGWWFEMPLCPLWRHCNGYVTFTRRKFHRSNSRNQSLSHLELLRYFTGANELTPKLITLWLVNMNSVTSSGNCC